MRASSEALPTPYTFLKGSGRGCPSFALREQEGHLAAPSPSFSGRAFREHRRSSGSIPFAFREQEDDQAAHPTLGRV